jgi:hypothetical protein
MKPEPVYAIPGTDSNMPAIKKHCLGDCNRLTMGLMIVAGYPAYVCTHADCQYIGAEATFPGQSEKTGQLVIGRLVSLQ